MSVTFSAGVFTVAPNADITGTGTMTCAATTVSIGGVQQSATACSGVGTAFLAELRPGSFITISGVGQRLMLVEMCPGGNVLKPLSQYTGKRMVVCAPPAGTNLALFDLGVDHITERHIPYGFLDLVRIGLRLLPMRLIDTRGWGGDGEGDKVCSLLPAMLYKRMGGHVGGIPSLAAPAEAVNALVLRLEIEGGR